MYNSIYQFLLFIFLLIFAKQLLNKLESIYYELNTLNSELVGKLDCIETQINNAYNGIDYPDEPETIINPDIIKREKLFDDRIEAIKMELNGQMSMFDNMTNGEILEKGIYNIPHHTVSIDEEPEIAE